MYYEKLSQGYISGWRIRTGHLWRFENGGFQGRGMKQEEAMAQQQKDAESAITDKHKRAAAEALAAGHPGVRTSRNMSLPGISSDSPGGPPAKRIKLKPTSLAGLSGGLNKKGKIKRGDVELAIHNIQQQQVADAQAEAEARARAASRAEEDARVQAETERVAQEQLDHLHAQHQQQQQQQQKQQQQEQQRIWDRASGSLSASGTPQSGMGALSQPHQQLQAAATAALVGNGFDYANFSNAQDLFDG